MTVLVFIAFWVPALLYAWLVFRPMIVAKDWNIASCLGALIGLVILYIPIEIWNAWLTVSGQLEQLVYASGVLALVWMWLCFRKRSWFRHHLVLGYLSFGLISVGVLGSLYLGVTNPTTYRMEIVETSDGDRQIMTGNQILKRVSQQQGLIVLYLLEHYDGIQSITIEDIVENPRYIGMAEGRQFYVTVLINDQYRVLFNLDLDATRTNHIDFLSYVEMDTYSGLHATDREQWQEYDINNLSEPSCQQLLQSIEVTYYTKNDIYKDYHQGDQP